MPWRTRGNKRYYYRSVRTTEGPRSVYVGTGPAAVAIAAADELHRLERQKQDEKLAATRAEISQMLGPVIELNENMELLTRAALLAAGFYHHSRSEWRRRRHEDEPQSR